MEKDEADRFLILIVLKKSSWHEWM
jgi:hypothetical protein